MSQASITVYSTGPTCQRCKATKRVLDAKGVKYDEVDLTDKPHWLETFRERGLATAPVVIVERANEELEVWDGHRPDRINAAVIRHGLIP